MEITNIFLDNKWEEAKARPEMELRRVGGGQWRCSQYNFPIASIVFLYFSCCIFVFCTYVVLEGYNRWICQQYNFPIEAFLFCICIFSFLLLFLNVYSTNIFGAIARKVQVEPNWTVCICIVSQTPNCVKDAFQILDTFQLFADRERRSH